MSLNNLYAGNFRIPLALWLSDLQTNRDLLKWINEGENFCRELKIVQMAFLRKAIFHKSILSSHIFSSANRIMIEVIFANLTEEKNVLAFNFSS